MIVTPNDSEPTLWSTFLALIPVLTGAIIGVAGTLAGTRYTSHLDELRQRTSAKRGKLEALVQAAYAVDEWLDKERDAYLWDGPKNTTPNPAFITDAITLLHLPGLCTLSDEFYLQTIECRKWIYEGMKQKLRVSPPVVPQTLLDTFEAAYNAYLDRRANLLKAAKASMQELEP